MNLISITDEENKSTELSLISVEPDPPIDQQLLSDEEINCLPKLDSRYTASFDNDIKSIANRSLAYQSIRK